MKSSPVITKANHFCSYVIGALSLGSCSGASHNPCFTIFPFLTRNPRLPCGSLWSYLQAVEMGVGYTLILSNSIAFMIPLQSITTTTILMNFCDHIPETSTSGNELMEWWAKKLMIQPESEVIDVSRRIFWRQNQFLGHEIFMASWASICHYTKYGSLVTSGMSGTRQAIQMEFCWCMWPWLCTGWWNFHIFDTTQITGLDQ